MTAPPAALGTKVSSLPSMDMTELECENPFRAKGSIAQEDQVLTPLYHKWPKSSS